jgi:hypothetical protein
MTCQVLPETQQIKKQIANQLLLLQPTSTVEVSIIF